MDTIIKELFGELFSSGVNIVLLIGWILFLLERFYMQPKREMQFREDLEKWRADYHTMSEHTQEALSRLTIVLEVIKDRTERNSGGGS